MPQPHTPPPAHVRDMQARLEEGVQRGVLVRGNEDNEFLVWRYDGVRFRFCMKCYHGKRGYTLTSNDRAIEADIAAGNWDRLPARARADALDGHEVDHQRDASGGPAHNDERPIGHNQHGTLRRLTVSEGAVPRARRGRALQRGDLSPDQAKVFDDVVAWLAAPEQQVLTLGGYAGTGKSTLIGLLAQHDERERRIGFCAFTGKAASVLRGKLRAAGVKLGAPGKGHACGTIHSLIYEAIVDEATGRVLDWRRRDQLDCELLIVDEASMVTEEMLTDLASYGVPILAVGDHGQLPPVGSRGSLMEAPDLRLEQIHRQARDNPIIDLSARIRGGEDPGRLQFADARVQVVHEDEGMRKLRTWLPDPTAASDTIVLCRFNATRVRLNDTVRSVFDFDDTLLAAGDHVVCLRNERFGGAMVANGMRGVVHGLDLPRSAADAHRLVARIDFPDEAFSLAGRVSRHQFGQEKTFAEFADAQFATTRWYDVGMLFDYGYALTVHKAQGSQFRRAVVFRERGGDSEFEQRWLYTAVTRASEELVLVEAR